MENDEQSNTCVIENNSNQDVSVADGNEQISTSENDTSYCNEVDNETTGDDNSVKISQLKKAIVNHESSDVKKCHLQNSEINCKDILDAAVKKVNGQLDKNESLISDESELCPCSRTNEEIKDKDKENCNNDEREEKETAVKENFNNLKRRLSHGSETSNCGDDESEGSSPAEFRVYKRRRLYINEKEKKKKESDDESDDCDYLFDEEPVTVELRRSARNAMNVKRRSYEAVKMEVKEESGDQLTEYAQYLGLQPTVKFKCSRCGEKHFQTMGSLNAHQKMCRKLGSNALTKPVKPQVDSNLSANFRITRKVYLCSACGTYYENWKLFLHMRDMHKRHICLFCLGMFSVADKLAEHLLFKHNVHEKKCKSPEEFLNLFKGSCYLTCCTCEKMFTEREDFYDHQCKELSPPTTNNSTSWNNESVTLTAKDIKELSQKCTLCGVKCGHFRTCPNVTTKFPKSPSPSTSPSVAGNVLQTNTSSNISLAKYYIPVPANVKKTWTSSKTVPGVIEPPATDKDSYYDVSNAATFCHVDMANDSDNQSSPEKSMRENKISDILNNPIDVIPGENTSGNNKTESDTSMLPNDNNSNLKLISDENCNLNSKAGVKLEKTENHEGNENKSIEDDSDVNKNTTDSKENEVSTEEDNGSNNIPSATVNELNDDVLDEKEEVIEKQDVEETKEEEKECNNESSGSKENSDCVDKPNRLNDNTLSSNSDVENDDDGEDSKGSSGSGSSNTSIESENNDSGNAGHLNEGGNNDDSTGDCLLVEKRSDNETSECVLDAKDNSLNETVQVPSPNSENDTRFESDKGSVEKCDGNESEDSDKLSVVISEGPSEETRNTNDTEMFCEKQEEADPKVMNGVSNVEPMEPDNAMNCGNDEIQGDMNVNVCREESQKELSFKCDGLKIPLASEEVMAMALTLEDKMDCLSSQSVIKECVRTSCTTCSYCSHAVKIGVNGKQIAIHLLMEHRYMPVKNETVEDVVERLKSSLNELQDVWFNTDSYDSSDKSCFVPYDHTYECFQCNYVTNTHKDLFSHKRKVHQKTILYCSMCKENFYSYSEILCHMCPGVYDVDSRDIRFRCCLCECDRIPSAFRLMVHLRKTHHTCDICLEIAGDQQKLSTHLVKHKLHHLCYRCGIAYRNKPDITKHLFWKHGTESVLCKKCLQKKWPHVYHFCIPPSSFICEECNLSFSRAVHLKVHKRFHTNNFQYRCGTCESKFVSKKLLIKHEKTHDVTLSEEHVKVDNQSLPPVDVGKCVEQNELQPTNASLEQTTGSNQETETSEKCSDVLVKSHKKKNKKDKEKKLKPVVDVYDLPPLNLSSESDDSDEDKERDVKSTRTDNESDKGNETATEISTDKTLTPIIDEEKVSDGSNKSLVENDNSKSICDPVMDEEAAPPVTVVDGVWDNFHTYKAEQEKRENLDSASKQTLLMQMDTANLAPTILNDAVLGDHDYCIPSNCNDPSMKRDDTDVVSDGSKSKEHISSIDHDYCTQKNSGGGDNVLLNVSNENVCKDTLVKKKQKSPKKKASKHHNSSSSSDSSSDSDSSSCSCGTNCSCTSSSSNSSTSSSSDSDSSSSEGRHNTSSKREKKKDKLKNKRKSDPVLKGETPVVEPALVVPLPSPPTRHEESLIGESDLETDETATDEDFYDQYPQKHANQMLAEKRNQLMVLATVAPTVNNGTASPPVPNTNINIDPISSPKLEIVTPPLTPAAHTPMQKQSKRKTKTKKRRKSLSGNPNRNRNVSKLNLVYNTPQPSTSFSMTWQSSPAQNMNVETDVPMSYTPAGTTPVSSGSTAENVYLSTPNPQKSSSLCLDSNSSKRFSKRRRVRNKFYGYSSDEEEENQVLTPPPVKWKKTITSTPELSSKLVIHQHVKQQPAVVSEQQSHSNHQPKIPLQTIKILPTFDEARHKDSVNSDALTKKVSVELSSESSSGSGSEEDSDSDTERLAINQPPVPAVVIPMNINVGASEKDDKLYCYCQCPYDEVSEMIACDGIDCLIEWFHFECVGIMVPPKGKWYCPDCRKRRGLS